MYLNEILKNRYGTNLKGQPLFRVVLADTQFEKRFGTYNEFYGKIFIRTIQGLREVPKYPYLKGKYVLEKWAPPEAAYDPQIPQTQEGSYEPVYVYQDANCNPLPVIESFTHEVIWHLFNKPLPGHAASLAKTEDEVAFNREVQLNADAMDISETANALHGGEGVFIK